MPDLEERVAALEEAVLRLPRFLLPPVPELTPEQVAELRGDIEAALEAGPYEHRILPSAPPLTPGQVRSLLRECVTVVKPGETLVLRCPESWTPQQAGEMAAHARRWLEENAPDVRILVVPHLEMAVMEADPGGADGDGQP